MAARVQSQKDTSTIAELRKEAGVWLRRKREEAGFSQRELAAKVGFEYYTFISQIESGRGKLPADRYEGYADALNIQPREFATTMLRYNDPHIYSMIFGSQEEPEKQQDMSAIENRLRLLEAKLL